MTDTSSKDYRVHESGSTPIASCDFYKQVVREEGASFVTGAEILIRLYIMDGENKT